jgi:hypothetical protein
MNDGDVNPYKKSRTWRAPRECAVVTWAALFSALILLTAIRRWLEHVSREDSNRFVAVVLSNPD